MQNIYIVLLYKKIGIPTEFLRQLCILFYPSFNLSLEIEKDFDILKVSIEKVKYSSGNLHKYDAYNLVF